MFRPCPRTVPCGKMRPLSALQRRGGCLERKTNCACAAALQVFHPGTVQRTLAAGARRAVRGEAYFLREVLDTRLD